MRKIGYNLVKSYIKLALHLYFGKIKISGLGNIPLDKPVMILPNHQNALLDALLMAVQCNRKTYFLTRSDVFKNNFVVTVLNFFRMIPIYRIRDGRESLKNNQEVFDRCSRLLAQGHAILMFPEANHNLKRRVRPLSKGFTRILFHTLENSPDLDIRIVPVGINYRFAATFPDRVALHCGEDIAVKTMYNPHDRPGTIDRIKNKVGERLKTLTTHIEDEARYDDIVRKLDALKVDYLNPKKVNEVLTSFEGLSLQTNVESKRSWTNSILKAFFVLLNFPVWLIWTSILKPKVPEMEFMGTFRFAFSLVVYPIYYLILFSATALIWNGIIGLFAVIGLFLFNLAYVRWG